MSSVAESFGAALAAARQVVGAQDYPQGSLYVVATPIGNLGDVTLRALHVLGLADRSAGGVHGDRGKAHVRRISRPHFARLVGPASPRIKIEASLILPSLATRHVSPVL